MTSDLRQDKKCGASGIPEHKKCTKTTTASAPEPVSDTQSSGITTATLLSVGGVTAVSGMLGVLGLDLFTKGVPDSKVPPKEPPEGLYDTFQPGDLLYQVDEFLGANRAHYAVYIGKVNGEHRVFDTSLHSTPSKDKTQTHSTSVMRIRSIKEAQSTGTSFAQATRVSEDKKRPTAEQLNEIVNRLNNKSFDWTGYESNCETLARSIVNDLPISTQSKDVSQLTVQAVKMALTALAPPGYRERAVKPHNVERLVARIVEAGSQKPSTKVRHNDSLSSGSAMQRLEERSDAASRRCGQGHISGDKKCRKGGAYPNNRDLMTAAVAAGAIGLTAGGIAAAMGGREEPKPKRPSPPAGPASLPDITPRALLKPAPPRKSKTQRMRENTQAAMANAEGRIAQTAREEVRRVAQIGNTMAAAGEASGMAAKTTFRELRLRAEAARRRFEPGYRRGKPAQPKPPAQLPEGGQQEFQVPFNPGQQQPPEAIPLDPRTGQPRRRRARGFGRSDSLHGGLVPGKLI